MLEFLTGYQDTIEVKFQSQVPIHKETWTMVFWISQFLTDCKKYREWKGGRIG